MSTEAPILINKVIKSDGGELLVYQEQEPEGFSTLGVDLQGIYQALEEGMIPTALKFVSSVELLKEGTVLEKDLTVLPEMLRPYQEVLYTKEFMFGSKTEIASFSSYTPDPYSASLGLVETPIDKRESVDKDGKLEALRFELDENGEPIFWQKGPKAMKMAFAARLEMFAQFHNSSMYEYLRNLRVADREEREWDKLSICQKAFFALRHPQSYLSKLFTDPEIVRRSNKRSPVIENLLKFQEGEFLCTAAFNELGYARQSSDEIMSRSKSADRGLFVVHGGVPSLMFGLGGMPPVTGWRDVLTTSAMMFSRSWIPRNSLFADPERQLKLFRQARDVIKSFNLASDIEEMVLGQIGICVGSENPEAIAQLARQFYNEGCRAIRIYTTNPDSRTVETAKQIRALVGENMTICVAPLTDEPQAEKLLKVAGDNLILTIGHGGGENCTSLEGGGAANALELLYRLSLKKKFNRVALALEGGVGSTIGSLLGMTDYIFLNRRGVGGGIETGGLSVQCVDGLMGMPYHGSASPITQRIEAIVNESIMGRLRKSGTLRNVEGKPGFMYNKRSVYSIVDNIWGQMMLAGRALADQGVGSLHRLRKKIKQKGYNHRIVTPDAQKVAAPHRGR